MIGRTSAGSPISDFPPLRAIMLKLPQVGKTFHNQQNRYLKTHLLKVEILHHKRREIKAGHVIKHQVGID